MRKYIPSTNRPTGIAIVILLPLFFSIAIIARAEREIQACLESARRGLLEVPDYRSLRFLGKVEEDGARCRGGDKAVQYRNTAWVDRQNYYATGDAASKHQGREARNLLGEHVFPSGRGVDGALLDMEFQRIELINSIFSIRTPTSSMYYELAKFRQEMNQITHLEPTGDEVFD